MKALLARIERWRYPQVWLVQDEDGSVRPCDHMNNRRARRIARRELAKWDKS